MKCNESSFLEIMYKPINSLSKTMLSDSMGTSKFSLGKEKSNCTMNFGLPRLTQKKSDLHHSLICFIIKV